MKNLPKNFLEILRRLNHPAYDRLPEVIEEGEACTSVRLNPFRKISGDFEGERVAWNDAGVYLNERPSFTLDPRLHQGVYYVQEASSMFIRRAVESALRIIDVEDRPVRYLDACAAPGGKTTAAADVLPADAFIVANEFDAKRARILVENLTKWGVEAYITRSDAADVDFPDGFFDIIAADVPCSGEGMMRKDDYAIEQWSEGLVRECAERQRKIVENLWKKLRPGGVLIYSTCTYNISENEEIVDYMKSCLGGEVTAIDSPPEECVGARGGFSFPVCRFVPGEVRGEGLFMAMVRKPSEDCIDDARGGRRDSRIGKPGVRDRKSRGRVESVEGLPAGWEEWLEGDYVEVEKGCLRVVRRAHADLYEMMRRRVPPIAAGIEMGVKKGAKFIPSHGLGLARAFRRGSFPEAEVDRATAMKFLRREAVTLPGECARGIVLLTFEGNPLGWVNNLGARANNLYPESWRVRMHEEG